MKRKVIFLLIAVCLIHGGCNEVPESMIKDAEEKRGAEISPDDEGSVDLEFDDKWQGEFEFTF